MFISNEVSKHFVDLVLSYPEILDHLHGRHMNHVKCFISSSILLNTLTLTTLETESKSPGAFGGGTMLDAITIALVSTVGAVAVFLGLDRSTASMAFLL